MEDSKDLAPDSLSMKVKCPVPDALLFELSNHLSALWRRPSSWPCPCSVVFRRLSGRGSRVAETVRWEGLGHWDNMPRTAAMDACGRDVRSSPSSPLGVSKESGCYGPVSQPDARIHYTFRKRRKRLSLLVALGLIGRLYIEWKLWNDG